MGACAAADLGREIVRLCGLALAFGCILCEGSRDRPDGLEDAAAEDVALAHLFEGLKVLLAAEKLRQLRLLREHLEEALCALVADESLHIVDAADDREVHFTGEGQPPDLQSWQTSERPVQVRAYDSEQYIVNIQQQEPVESGPPLALDFLLQSRRPDDDASGSLDLFSRTIGEDPVSLEWTQEASSWLPTLLQEPRGGSLWRLGCQLRII